MLIRTVVFPLYPTDEQAKALSATQSLYTEAWQECVDVAWELERPTSIEVHKTTYKPLRERLGLKSQFVCSARNRAVESVKSVRERLRKKRKAGKPKGKTIPVRLDARTLSFDKDRLNASVTTQAGRMRFALQWHRQALRYQTWNCKSGEFALNRKGCWVLRLHFEAEASQTPPTGKAVGVDRGICTPVVTSENRFLGKRHWKEKERQLSASRSRLQSKGTKSAKQRLKKVAGRLRRFRVDCDRVLAKEMLAPLSSGDTVVLENLTNIRERVGKKGRNIKRNRSNIGRWSFRRLESSLRNRAELSGIQIVKVNAHYTSQTCCRCGVIEKSNRKSQSSYRCACGNQVHADLNAARNIQVRWLTATSCQSGAQSIVPRCSVR